MKIKTKKITAKNANAAIFYAPDGYDTGGKKLMGRQAAGEGFLKGMAAAKGLDALHCYSNTKPQFNDFQKRVTGYWEGEAKKPLNFIQSGNHQKLEEVGCLYYPSPGLGDLAWRRRYYNQRAYSLCGVTHTTASSGVTESLGKMLVDPLQPWDALICTSESVKKMVQRTINDYGDYLGERIGAKPALPIQLPVIPLGIDTAPFKKDARKKRVEYRQKMKIAKSEIVVLFMGRLSYHAKAHPLPMYLALEEVAKRTGKKIRLVQVGWFANDALEKAFREGAKQFAPSVRHHFLDGRKRNIRENIWHIADIFCSLSDNIQETFGLVPVEAMAAGIPVVVTDWDGYRETVRDGVDGFTIRTTQPAAGYGTHLARSHAEDHLSYDRYIGYSSQVVGVDIPACITAFTALVENPSLRNKMAKAGQKRAQNVYDWSVVVKQYQSLWAELATLRSDGAETCAVQKGAQVQPLRADPFHSFSHYPTDHLSEDKLISLAKGVDYKLFQTYQSNALNSFARRIFCSDHDCKLIIDLLEKQIEKTPVVSSKKGDKGSASMGTFCVADVLAKFSDDFAKRRQVILTLSWLHKMGLVLIG
ncbi:MAG: glycosyltransferase family 4 protein [Alphaproteobacteria bacterium]